MDSFFGDWSLISTEDVWVDGATGLWSSFNDLPPGNSTTLRFSEFDLYGGAGPEKFGQVERLANIHIAQRNDPTRWWDLLIIDLIGSNPAHGDWAFGCNSVSWGNAPEYGEQCIVGFTAPPAPGPGGTYATVEELLALLRIENPTDQQTVAAQRALEEAKTEIDWELGYDDADHPAPFPYPPLVVGVNLDRAVEHWRQSYSPFGVIGVGSESEPIIAARNSWYRHALKLRPLKEAFGVA